MPVAGYANRWALQRSCNLSVCGLPKPVVSPTFVRTSYPIHDMRVSFRSRECVFNIVRHTGRDTWEGGSYKCINNVGHTLPDTAMHIWNQQTRSTSICFTETSQNIGECLTCWPIPQHYSTSVGTQLFMDIQCLSIKIRINDNITDYSVSKTHQN
jgi:hypothetical protein